MGNNSRGLWNVKYVKNRAAPKYLLPRFEPICQHGVCYHPPQLPPVHLVFPRETAWKKCSETTQIELYFPQRRKKIFQSDTENSRSSNKGSHKDDY